MPSSTLLPTQSGHDAEEYTGVGGDGSVATGTVVISAATNSFGQPDLAGTRMTFQKFPLPVAGWLANKTIVTATLEWYSVNTKSNTVACDFYAEKVASPATATTATSGISTRARTTAKVSLSLPTWSSGVRASLAASGGVSITDLIAEVVSFAGAVNIDALAFIVVKTSGTGERQWATFDNGINLPSLILDYTTDPFRVDEKAVRVIRTDRRTVRE